MILIVAHHYVVNSGVLEILAQEPSSARSIFYYLFGMWGKTAINCFVMITGYFMCTKAITVRKFLTLLAEVYFYRIVIFIIFLICGKESISFYSLFELLIPVQGVGSGFVDSFLLFYLLIPFLTIIIIVQHTSRRQHLMLVTGSLLVFSVMGTIPFFPVIFNYVEWFCILFFLASFVRLHPHPVFMKKKLWGGVLSGTLFLSYLSVIFCIWAKAYFHLEFLGPYWFVSDSNKLLAVAVALSSFLWVKNLDLKQSPVINTIAATTFGVFLIHTNSDAMREWLWVDTLNVAGQFDASWGSVLLHSFGCVVLVFAICSLLDYCRECLFKVRLNGRN